MKKIKKIFSKFMALTLVVSMISMSSIHASLAKATYVALDFVSGIQPNLMMAINEKSLNLDLAKTENIRVRFDPSELLKIVPAQGTATVKLYEVIGGERHFVTSHSLNMNSGARKNRILSIDAGSFSSPTKQVELDLIDAANNLINTYSATLQATNLVAQASSIDSGVNIDNSVLSQDQLDQFFERVSFVPYRNRQASSEVVKNDNGLYQVRIPYPRKFAKFFRGRRTRVVVSEGTTNTGNTGNTNGGVASSFGENLDASTLRLGSDLSNYGRITFDPTSDNLIFGYGNNLAVENSVFLHDSGKFGIGVMSPSAFLEIKQGDTSTAPLKLNAGALTTIPQDGAIEFDGDEFYATKNGVRTILGSGAGGSLVNGATTNGSINFLSEGSLDNASLNGNTLIEGDSLTISLGSPQAGYVLTSDANGVATWQPAGSSSSYNNISVDNGTYIDGSISNSNIEGGTVNNTLITNSTVNGTLNFLSGAEILGGVINGATLVNVSIPAPPSVNNVDNATTANSADFANLAASAINADFASSADSATTAVTATNLLDGDIENASILNSKISASEIFGGVINGATLVNVSIPAPPTVANVDNATTANTADFATAAGSATTAASADTANFATTAGSATSADSATTATNLAGGTMSNTIILDNVLNGTITTLADAEIDGDLKVSQMLMAETIVADSITFPSGLTIDGSTVLGGSGANVDNATTANTADFATSAGTATSAASADYATTAGSAASAASADFATTAASATNADYAISAASADFATTAGSVSGGSVDNVTISNATLSDGVLDGTLTIASGSNFDGDLSIDGELTADKFIGDGSMLTGISVANVGNATTANTADFATSAGSATTADTATSAGTANFATTAGSATSASTADTATTATNVSGGSISGVTSISTTGSIDATGNITANKFIGDGSMLTGINVSNSDNADTATTAKSVVGDVSLSSSGIIGVTPSAGLTVTDSMMRIQGYAGHVNITANPQISAGDHDGQLLMIRGMSDSATVTFEDGDGIVLSFGVQFKMGANDILTLIYDDVAKLWIEVSRSDR